MMVFREAVLSDVPELLELEQKVVVAERPFNQAIKNGPVYYYNLEALITDPLAHVIIAQQTKIVATGYALIKKSKPALKHDKHAYLGFMYTAEDYRGQGLNRLIIEQLKVWCKKQGINDYYLDVYAENTSAIRAYKKCGFSNSMIEMKLHD